ncbi:MAG: GAF and ANTAR domain-containing protein [Actinomycetota bacterium]|nr:GAF and ANTAR domain-containing protein [Actinomycetota bacterium]MDQ2956470.1 GAF and ANTAR domain-containing protein [Actinomycetota bacterium]
MTLSYDQAENTADQPSVLYLAEKFAELARTVSAQPDEEATWQAIVQATLHTIEGTEQAGVSILRGNQFRTVAPSSDLPVRVDAIQYELRSGPCVDAVLQETIFRTGDLEHDPRWPEFGRRAATEEGVHSMLALRLYLEEEEPIGGLNLYSSKHHAFTEASATTGAIFAVHAAIALSSARVRDQVHNLQAALESNREIGIAIGILMSRHRITQQQGFDLLRMASQHSQRKLRDIAGDVVETGMLDLPAAAAV